MNSKIAKLLRKRAKQETVGQPDRVHLQNKATREVRLDPNCTQGRYKLLKKAYKLAYRGAYAK